MGKNIIQQARGRGGPSYRARSFVYAGEVRLRPETPSTINGTITDIIKCPGHGAPLLQITYEDGIKVLMPAPESVRVGDTIQAGPGSSVNMGNVLPLREISEGTPVFSIEAQPGDGGKFCRTGGASAKVVSKSETHATVMLPSKKEKKFHLSCRAAIGIIAGGGKLEKPLLKAGATHYNKRRTNKHWPIPRGSAMNAVDHPFGNKRTSRKAKQKAVGKFAPPGRKVGKMWPKRTGKKK